ALDDDCANRDRRRRFRPVRRRKQDRETLVRSEPQPAVSIREGHGSLAGDQAIRTSVMLDSARGRVEPIDTPCCTEIEMAPGILYKAAQIVTGEPMLNCVGPKQGPWRAR